MYDEQVLRAVRQAADRLKTDIAHLMPRAGAQILAWMLALSKSEDAEDRLMGPDMFPVLLLPWWVARSTPEAPDEAFHVDLAYASMCAYYHVRLVDNLMDEEATTELEILPATAFFQRQSTKTLYRYFPPEHAFWTQYDRYWYASAEWAMTDARFETIDRDTFETISAQKICAAQIPLAAACYHYGLPHTISHWTRFCNLLGCYHQMFDDVSDWMRDAGRTRNTTYLLSEAQRCSRPGESVMAWLARAGFTWSTDQLRHYLQALREQAPALASPDVLDYLQIKTARFEAWHHTLAQAFKALDETQSIFNAD